ncbi:MAG: hypothetical protein FJW26_20740, partial [Acidimicrobiia bacterium]|nr:hypothetical protein [Acidimicrobiia bacterium]
MRLALNRIILAALLAAGCIAPAVLSQERGKIARPVDTEKSFERSAFQAEHHQVWTRAARPRLALRRLRGLPRRRRAG